MEDFIDESLKLLKINQIKTLKQWAGLSDEDKKKYHSALVDIFDNASLPQGMSFVLQYKILIINS